MAASCYWFVLGSGEAELRVASAVESAFEQVPDAAEPAFEPVPDAAEPAFEQEPDVVVSASEQVLAFAETVDVLQASAAVLPGGEESASEEQAFSAEEEFVSEEQAVP